MRDNCTGGGRSLAMFTFSGLGAGSYPAFKSNRWTKPEKKVFMKLPSMQWYPGDWRKDPGVQSLSYEERGIWFELLMLMHDCEPRGKLMLNGQKISHERVGFMLRLTEDRISQAISQFISLGVASVCEDTGAVMCRRMVRDEQKREKLSGYGKMGGNPAFEKGKDNPYHKPQDKPSHKPTPKPNISPSSSTSVRNSVLSEPRNGHTQKTAIDAAGAVTHSYPPFEGEDPQQVISQLVEDIAKIWQNHASVPRARSAAEHEWAKSNTDVTTWASSVLAKAHAWKAFHAAAKKINSHHFIPSIERWFVDGDYARPVPEEIAEAPPKPPRQKSSLEIVKERIAKEKADNATRTQ